MTSVLKEPRRKGHSNSKPGEPLPVLVESVTGIPAHLALFQSFSGRFNGDCVEVCDAKDKSSLYNMGFFGKGSLSRSCPRSARRTQNPEIIRERQWRRRCEWTSMLEDGEVSEQEDGSRLSHSSDKETEVIVIADVDTESDDFISSLRPRLEKDTGSLPEVLNLLLEEALFLSYGLGCLYICDIFGQRILSCLEFWHLCLESDVKFLQRYVAYHHFRSKGWVVKSGLKFAGDFLLYKHGPSFYHASYVVLTKVIYGENPVDTGELCETKTDWVTLMGLNRLAETSGKEVLLCYVICPSEFVPSQSSPDIIKKCKVHEVIMRRWQSSVARIDDRSDSSEKKENDDDIIP